MDMSKCEKTELAKVMLEAEIKKAGFKQMT